MFFKNRKQIIQIVIFYFVLFAFLIVGIWLRLATTPRYLYENVVSYYYHRTNVLWEQHTLPLHDKWSFAPETMPENMAPLLSYSTVLLYAPFHRMVSLLQFVLVVPALLYVVWALAAAYFLRKQVSWRFILAFILLLTILPESVNLFRAGHYTEEIVGVPLVFFLLIFSIRFVEHSRWGEGVGVFFSALLLCLAWPQFPAPLAVIGATALITLFFKKKRQGWGLLTALFLALGIGHIISLFLFRSAYSPTAMLYEAWIGMRQFNNVDLLLSMKRNDWANATGTDVLARFGWLGVVLGIIGLVRLGKSLGQLQNFLPFFFFLTTVAIYAKFVKSAVLLLPVLLFTAAYGVEGILDKKTLLWFSQKPGGFWAKSVLGILVIGGILLGIDFLNFQNNPKPVGSVIVDGLPQNITSGSPFTIRVVLTNGNVPTLQDGNAFAGLHIEVKNAHLQDKSASSSPQPRLVVKPNAQSGDWYWYEVIFPYFGRQKQGIASFTLLPTATPIEIRVRGWLPGSCPWVYRLSGMVDRSSEFANPFVNGWRHESCIVRLPSVSLTYVQPVACAIEVGAGYKKAQTFQCYQYVPN